MKAFGKKLISLLLTVLFVAEAMGTAVTAAAVDAGSGGAASDSPASEAEYEAPEAEKSALAADVEEESGSAGEQAAAVPAPAKREAEASSEPDVPAADACLESAHDYANDTDETKTLTREGADLLDVTFSAETMVETGYDFIYLYDGSDQELGKYTGSELAGKTVRVFGDTVKVRLVSDADGAAYGYAVTSAEPKMVQKFSIKTPPEKTQYGFRDSLDLTGLTAAFLYTDGTEEILDSGFTAEPCDLSVPGEKTVSVSWRKWQTSFSVTVENVLAQGTCGEALTWKLEPDGTLMIEGSGAMGDYTSNTSPWYAYKEEIKVVSLPDGLTTIGRCAFYSCYNVTAVTIPDGVTSIGGSAFYGCTGLTEITIPDSVQSIEGNVLYNTGWYNSQPDGLLYLDGVLWGYKGARPEGDVIIQKGTRVIASSAFGHCFLTAVTIPDSVTSIGESVFSGCTSLKELTVSSNSAWSVSSFENCSNISKLTITGSGMFNRNGMNLTNLTTLVIQKGVTGIEEYAFKTCEGLTEVTIPDSVTSIGDSAFYGCMCLTAVTIPDSVTSIGDSAFYSCMRLTAATIPDSVTSIGDSAFYGCNGLTAITLPDSVISIGDSAFYGCTGLKELTISSNSVWSESSFNNCHNISKLTVTGSGVFYRRGKILSSLAELVLQEGVTGIGESAFYGCYRLTEVTIPDRVTSIGSSAFSGCSGLTEVTIPDSVTTINNYAFSGCTGLTGITLPDSVTSIGSYAFEDCDGLTAITLPDSVASIGRNAFYGCTGLKELTISSNSAWTASSYDGSFNGCKNISKLTVTGSGVFNKSGMNLTNLTELVIQQGVTGIGANAFSGCTGLTEIAIPDGVTSIGSSAFSGCSGLTEVTIPNSVTWIDNSAFRGCTGLTAVTIPDSVTAIGKYAFYGSGLCSIRILNPECRIYGDYDTIPSGAVIYGPWNSKAQAYAKSYGRVFKHLEHTGTVLRNARPASCVEAGYTGDVCCVDCGEILTAGEEIPSLGGHLFGEYQYHNDASCVQDGTETAVCSRCGEEDTRVVKGTAHGAVKFRVANTASGVEVRWTAVNGADGYYVYRRTGSGGWTRIKTTTSTSYTDTAARAGTTYYYTVRAYRGSFRSAYESSGTAIKRLTQPTVSLANTSGGVKITWQKVTGASGYYVYRRTGGSGWARIKTTTGTSYTDTAARAGTTYDYTVKAYSGSVYSSYVTNKSIRRLTQPAVSVARTSSGIKASWNKVTGASGYYVYRKTGSGGWTKIKTTRSLYFTDTTAKKGTTYYYTVRAYAGGSLSSYTSSKSIRR